MDNPRSRRAAPKKAPSTGAELVAYWRSEGLIGSRPEIVDSQEHAREIRRKVKRREHPEP